MNANCDYEVIIGEMLLTSLFPYVSDAGPILNSWSVYVASTSANQTLSAAETLSRWVSSTLSLSPLPPSSLFSQVMYAQGGEISRLQPLP